MAYEDSPLIGVLYNRAVDDTFVVREKEVSFLAVPYFFGTRDKNVGINYQWMINGQEPAPPLNGSRATFRQEGDETGVSGISISASHAQKFMQSAKGDFVLRFGETNGL